MDLYDNRKRSWQYVNKNEAQKNFLKPSQNQKKVMLSVWWSSLGIIHHKFFKPGETITGEINCQELAELNKKLKKIRTALTNKSSPILLHDNARCHVSKKNFKKLYELNYEILPHFPYSPISLLLISIFSNIWIRF
uniref:Mariner Mos1 transposase n=1 Tax=Strongyloides papillosus TaxID=174720 RepID=A0A0N5CBW3_STREA